VVRPEIAKPSNPGPSPTQAPNHADHVVSQTEPALLSASERIQWIRQDRWIHYSRAEQVLNRLSDLLTYPARDRMPCLLLFGPTGMGKTRIVQKFLREHRSSFDDVTGRTRLPIVAVQMPPAPSERDLYEELLVSMGAVLPAHHYLLNRSDMIHNPT
jgi:Bacterial TniB protein